MTSARSTTPEPSVTVRAFDVGLVSRTQGLADFYRSAFDLAELEERRFPEGVVRRLQAGPAVLKVMVPADAPTQAVGQGLHWDVTGIRYLTFWVDDIDAAKDRCLAAGGEVFMGPAETAPGVHTMMVRDPDRNTLEVKMQAVRSTP